MTSKDKILRKVWNGRIPVCFQLSREDVPADKTPPPPFFLLVPRVTYFPLVIEKVIRQFQSYCDLSTVSPTGGLAAVSKIYDEVFSTKEAQQTDDLSAAACTNSQAKANSEICSPSSNETVYWLEFRSLPLKWHYQVGLLYDIYGSSKDLPWQIDVHFSNYPSDVLLAPPISRVSVETIFMSTVKEADALKHRSSVMNEMKPRDQRQLLNGLFSHTFEQFWSVNRHLMQPYIQSKPSVNASHRASPLDAKTSEDTVQSESACSENPSTLLAAAGMKAFRFCPFRLYFSPFIADEVNQTEDTTGVFASTLDQNEVNERQLDSLPPYIQRLVAPFLPDSGLPITFADVLNSLFSSSPLENTKLKPKNFVFLIHGVSVADNTPGQWLAENFSYPDNFVHIVARRRRIRLAN